MIGEFVPFASGSNGARVAAEDRDGDGKPDLVVGTGPNSSSKVRSYKGTNLAFLSEISPYDPAFLGGIFVG